MRSRRLTTTASRSPSCTPATPGAAVKLDIHPDGFRDPDFLWMEERDGQHRMTGGLIFHRSQGEWGIHT